MNKVPLSQMKAGEKGIVAEVREHGFLSQRLLEMGIIRGTPVEVIRFAPMGDPIDIKIRGYHLSLRLEEAQGILIDLTDEKKPA